MASDEMGLREDVFDLAQELGNDVYHASRCLDLLGREFTAVQDGTGSEGAVYALLAAIGNFLADAERRAEHLERGDYRHEDGAPTPTATDGEAA